MSIPAEELDVEVRALCEAMNELPGICTVESCCGHGETEFYIWFRADSLEALPQLLYWLDGCHTSFYGWRCEASTDCAMAPATFLVAGPTGEQGYGEADAIAALMRGDKAAWRAYLDRERPVQSDGPHSDETAS